MVPLVRRSFLGDMKEMFRAGKMRRVNVNGRMLYYSLPDLRNPVMVQIAHTKSCWNPVNVPDCSHQAMLLPRGSADSLLIFM